MDGVIIAILIITLMTWQDNPQDYAGHPKEKINWYNVSLCVALIACCLIDMSSTIIKIYYSVFGIGL